MVPPPTTVQRKCLGLLSRRERWGLSARGWLAMAGLGGAMAAVALFGAYPFLAVTQRVETKILVVEGWVDAHAIKAAVEEFHRGGYERVFTTGGPVRGLAGYLTDQSTTAGVGASRLRQAGLPAERVQMAPARELARDRTFGSAVALREWCATNGVKLARLNVLTQDVHARRTRLLFEQGLGPGVGVGIIAVPHLDYDAGKWWRYSEGVRSVIGEIIAYVYARCFFFPEAPRSAA
ncbi:MAG: ElyC/SanA/YdcF family protein [Opitutaceae bacterium]|nr:ElyC/SanA/YdcF family protein [Opitutaceae bacterium]